MECCRGMGRPTSFVKVANHTSPVTDLDKMFEIVSVGLLNVCGRKGTLK